MHPAVRIRFLYVKPHASAPFDFMPSCEQQGARHAMTHRGYMRHTSISPHGRPTLLHLDLTFGPRKHPASNAFALPQEVNV